MEIKRETKEETMLSIIENGQLVAIGYKDMASRHNIYYKVEEMSTDEMASKISNEQYSPKTPARNGE